MAQLYTCLSNLASINMASISAKLSGMIKKSAWSRVHGLEGMLLECLNYGNFSHGIQVRKVISFWVLVDGI